MDDDMFGRVSRYVDYIRDAERRKCQSRQVRKFDSLVSQSFKTDENTVSDWVMNISSSPLTMHQRSLLARGMNFSPTPKRIPTPQIIAEVEGAFKRSEACDNTIKDVRQKIIGALSRPPRGLFPNLSPQERKALKELKDKKDIIILPADKGKKTVVMDTTAYEEKLFELLDN